VSACQADHTFSIQTTLAAGNNTLLIQDFNITDDPGPATPTITVTYNPPAPPPSSSGGSTTPAASSGNNYGSSGSPQPLLLNTDFRFQAFTVGNTFNWNLTIQGGVAPYGLHADWGDRTTSDDTYSHQGTVTISHTYTKPGYFPVIVQLSDATGATTMIQLVAFIKSANGAGTLFRPDTTITPTSASDTGLLQVFAGSSKWLLLAWPTYIIISLMALSFWLGERQIYHRLLAAQAATHRRHAKSQH